MLLRTRFYIPPVRPNAVLRTALLQQLQGSSGGSLVLIAAPAGYGKTTLVSQWLHHHPHTFAWLSLGPEHNVIPVFWQYALSALQQILPEVGRDAERLALASDMPDYQQMVIALLNDLDRFSINNRANDAVTLVLDDFHLLHNPRLLALINLLLDHLPSCIRLVITTRSEPDLQLSRRRASGQLLQIGIAQLRFDTGEAATFFASTMGLASCTAQAAQLCERTEGWIAGLQLAALSLQREGSGMWQDSGLDKHIADYLLDEVFARLPGTLQTFLVHTAMVPRFCAGLCNAIESRQDSMQMLLELEAANLFLVPLDNHRGWFRYHDLFRQFLLQRFAQLAVSDQQSAISLALGWLEQNGYYDDAIDLCLERASWDAAMDLLQQLMADATTSASGARLARWLRQLPVTQLARNPALQQRLQQLQLADDARSSSAISHNGIEPLTRQEQAVLALIGQGHANKVIARTLQISLNTLKVHIRNLYGKMGVENRTQALLKMRDDERT